MGAISGILNHSANSSMGNVQAMASSSGSNSSSSSSSSSNSATITANDFLTLLVTEMQNQDPTATTDPNEYINQLVQVNSLQQLISINQTLSGALPSASGGQSSSGASAQQSNAANGIANFASGVQSASANSMHAAPASVPTTGGNLGVPHSNPAAQRVASALSGSHIG